MTLDELDRLHAAATAPHCDAKWVGVVRANARVALHNAWPSVSARLRAAEAEVERLREQNAAAITPRPRAEWHEDFGPVIWWRFPIEEPPYVGDPNWEDFPDYVTHWTKILVPEEP